MNEHKLEDIDGGGVGGITIACGTIALGTVHVQLL
jgi:hypothetical protein